MIIRDAEMNDFDAIKRLAIAFAHDARQIDVDPETLAFTVKGLIESGIFKVAVNGSVIGGAGALVFPHWWNASELVAQELFWFVDEDYRNTSAGIRLLLALEESAKSMGAKKMMMLCLEELDGEKVSKMYHKLGYAPQEQTFVKDL